MAPLLPPVLALLSCLLLGLASSRRLHVVPPRVAGGQAFANVSSGEDHGAFGGGPLFQVPAEYHCREHAYSQSARARCDAALYDVVLPVLEGGAPLYTRLDDGDFRAAWQCYAQDPCFMSPPGPSSVSLSVEDGAVACEMASSEQGAAAARVRVDLPMRPQAGQEMGETEKEWQNLAEHFRWYSFEEWRSALFDAVSRAISSAGEADIHLAIDVTSPGAANDIVKSKERLLFKSELWTLMHVLNAFGQHPKVKGVIWLKPGDGPIDVPTGLSGESAVLIPFDATYSGQQVGKTLKSLVTRLAPSVKVFAAVGIAGSKAKLAERIAVELDRATPTPEVLVGLEATQAWFAPQFKLPDTMSMHPHIFQLLRCALCCAGEDVQRTPYKKKTSRQRRPESCGDLRTPPSLGSRCSCPGGKKQPPAMAAELAPASSEPQPPAALGAEPAFELVPAGAEPQPPATAAEP